MLAIATVLTARAGFQAAKWSGVQAINFNEAGANRTESARASTTAGQLGTIDVTTWLTWREQAQLVTRQPEFATAADDPEVGAALGLP